MSRLLVIDANILIRGILGEQVPQLLEDYGGRVQFFTAQVCYDEIERHLPTILQRRKLPTETFLAAIAALKAVVVPLDEDVYGTFEEEAKNRIALRDQRDWPLLALALALDCPVWTEDNDFFGTGVATWHTQNVEIYLRGE